MEAGMRAFHGLDQIIDSINSIGPDNEWIYVNPEQWENEPLTCDYYVIPERWIWEQPEDQIFEDDEGLEFPLSVKGLGLRTFKTIGDFRHLVTLAHGQGNRQAQLIELIRSRADDRAGWARRNF